jgi:hypothetical protein
MDFDKILTHDSDGTSFSIYYTSVVQIKVCMEMKLNVGDAIARFQEQMADGVWSKPKQIILIAGSPYIAMGQGTAPRVRHSSSSDRDIILQLA